MVYDKIDSLLRPIFEEEEKPKVKFDRENTGIRMVCGNNMVSGETLKKIQGKTLKSLAEYLSPTFGPMGSYTQIIKGSDQDNTFAEYSKDGLTVLKKILYNRPIEIAIKTEMEEICRYVETRIGDGTTSSVILSYHIFSLMSQVQKKYSLPPHELKSMFETIIGVIKEEIKKNGRDITLDDIYNICMISTNRNKEVSKDISDIYRDYNMDVDISVEISTTTDNMVKEYDGITFDEGYSDPAYVNNKTTNTADIHNPRIYLFDDPVDNVHMISLFEKILHHNILSRISNNQEVIPTVIMCPRLSRDSISILNKVIEALYKYDAMGITNQKPQVLVITNYLGIGEGVAYDIGKLCGCKGIRNYIDAETEKKDQEAGDAPTIDTVCRFCGHAELVTADANKTKFVNPEEAMKNPEIHKSLIHFLENEIVTATERKADKAYINSIKERLKRLKDNNVEYYVGGIAISDRDALRDLVIDAVKNCKSATRNGVGYAANFEGLRASFKVVEWIQQECKKFPEDNKLKVTLDIATCLFQAYYTVAKILYNSAEADERKVDSMIRKSLERGYPFNLNDITTGNTKDDNGKYVLCSIETDIEILEAVKKIIGLMVSSNQCILPSVGINTY